MTFVYRSTFSTKLCCYRCVEYFVAICDDEIHHHHSCFLSRRVATPTLIWNLTKSTCYNIAVVIYGRSSMTIFQIMAAYTLFRKEFYIIVTIYCYNSCFIRGALSDVNPHMKYLWFFFSQTILNDNSKILKSRYEALKK